MRNVLRFSSLLPLALVFRSVAVCAETNNNPSANVYHTVMWIGDTAYKQPEKLPLFFKRLQEMGVNTAMVHGDSDPKPLLEAHFAYYVENMVNRGLCLKFNSKVQDWDKFVTAWAKNGREESGLVRDYCLDSKEWQDAARKQVDHLVRKNRDNHPVAYNIRDELSTTISANPFDYDFSPTALAAFREWLKTQYHDLSALNAEWETKFANWYEVKPFTTDQIKNRMATGEGMPRGKPDWAEVQQIKFEPSEARKKPTAWNFAPWADFRTYMDLSLARALKQLRDTAHELDPATPVGVEGTQMPHAFGGYDLWRLSQRLDWVEPYDIGNAREIFGSFMPGKPLMTTVFEQDTNPARRRLWHLLLEGDQGCIIWWSEDCIDWKSENYALTQKSKALTPVLNEMTSPVAALFLRAQRERDPIYIHYSQPSIQVDWLMESTVDGSTWLRRFSSFEAEHNRMAKARNGWLKALQDLGYSPVFVSSEQIEKGALKDADHALVLVQSWALSQQESDAIGKFLDGPGEPVVLCEGTPGLFDEHGRLLQKRPFEGKVPLSNSAVFALRKSEPVAGSSGGGAKYEKDRLKGDRNWASWLADKLKAKAPDVSVPLDARVRVHRFRLGNTRLLAFERNIDYHMSEDLKQAGGNESLEKSIEFEARLSKAGHVYDLRSEKYLGQTDRLTVKLDPWQPSLFCVSDEKLPEGKVIAALSSLH